MKWTEKELDILRERYPQKPLDITGIAKYLNRTRSSVKLKAARLGLCQERKIRKEDIDYIKENSSKMTIWGMSKGIGRSWNTIVNIIRKLGVKRYIYVHNKWIPTEQELDIIRSNATTPLSNISKLLNISIPSVNRVMKEMGLIKPRALRDPNIPRVARVRKPAKPKIENPVVPRDNSGIDRIRQAMERLRI